MTNWFVLLCFVGVDGCSSLLPSLQRAKFAIKAQQAQEEADARLSIVEGKLEAANKEQRALETALAAAQGDNQRALDEAGAKHAAALQKERDSSNGIRIKAENLAQQLAAVQQEHAAEVLRLEGLRRQAIDRQHAETEAELQQTRMRHETQLESLRQEHTASLEVRQWCACWGLSVMILTNDSCSARPC